MPTDPTVCGKMAGTEKPPQDGESPEAWSASIPGQRSIDTDMQQDNTKSCVYILLLNNGQYKVGGTANFRLRLRNHELDEGMPPFEVLHLIGSNAPAWAERYIHFVLRGFRVEGEIYNLSAKAVEWLKSIPCIDLDNEPTPPDFGFNPEVARRAKRGHYDVRPEWPVKDRRFPNRRRRGDLK